MTDRGMKKWRPFNAVVSGRELKNKDERETIPDLSANTIAEYEEMLKDSLYTHSNLSIVYIEGGKEKKLYDYVVKLDPIKKDVFLKTKKINFRQIKEIKK